MKTLTVFGQALVDRVPVRHLISNGVCSLCFEGAEAANELRKRGADRAADFLVAGGSLTLERGSVLLRVRGTDEGAVRDMANSALGDVVLVEACAAMYEAVFGVGCRPLLGVAFVANDAPPLPNVLTNPIKVAGKNNRHWSAQVLKFDTMPTIASGKAIAVGVRRALKILSPGLKCLILVFELFFLFFFHCCCLLKYQNI